MKWIKFIQIITQLDNYDFHNMELHNTEGVVKVKVYKISKFSKNKKN